MTATYCFFMDLYQMGGNGPWVYDSLIRPLEWQVYGPIGMDF